MRGAHGRATGLLAVLAILAGCSAEPGAPDPNARFVDHGDGTVSDNRTDLMWAQSNTELVSWGSAYGYADALELAGHDDWRLPTVAELSSLYDPAFSGYVPECTRTDQPVRVPPEIRLWCGAAWSSEHDEHQAQQFNFFHGSAKRAAQVDDYGFGAVAVPVRDR